MTAEQPKAAQGAERRNFFRIDDTVRLSLRVLSADELEDCLDRLDHGLAGNFTVMSGIASITAETTLGLRRIEKRDPELAAYLRAIDRKIELIGRALIAHEPELSAEQAVPVNLSAGGMCIGVDQGFAPGTPIETRMLLLPSLSGLVIYGNVVESSPVAAERTGGRFEHLTRIEFTHIREQDRELLIRHLLRRQSAQLRDRQGQDPT
jgi:hypothetical protein